MTTGRKISSFNSTTALASANTITLLVDGANVNISVADFAAALGLTGTMSQLGDPTGTPILTKVGLDNQIRNLENGPGVKASVSPEGGALLEHTFTQDAVSVPITVGLGASSPTFVSFQAGDGIRLSLIDTHIEINATGIATSQNVIIVNELSDFPSPSVGVITLADNTYYLISGTVALGTNTITAGVNSVIGGSDSSVSILTYTGTGTMFTSTADNFKITKVTAICTDGTLLDISSTGGGVFQMINMTVPTVDTIGTITDMAAIQLTDVAFNDIATNGILFAGNFGALFGERNLFNITAGKVIDLGTSIFQGKFSMDASFSDLAAGTVFLSGLVDSGNMAAGVLGTLLNMSFTGAGDPLENITVNDALWQFSLNDDIADTRPDGLLSFNTNVAETVIAVIGTPVLIAGTWETQSTSQFTGTAGGRLTYNGGKDTTIPVTLSLTGGPVSGTNIPITYHLYKNGSPVTGASQGNTISSTAARNTSLPWQITMTSTDYLEVFVSNDSTTANVLVIDAIFRIN
jgi:hypothetical protein